VFPSLGKNIKLALSWKATQELLRSLPMWEVHVAVDASATEAETHTSDRDGMTANLPDSFAPCLPPAPKLPDDKPPTVIDGTNLSAIKGRPTLVGSAARRSNSHLLAR
jgi:hypothetical protein